MNKTDYLTFMSGRLLHRAVPDIQWVNACLTASKHYEQWSNGAWVPVEWTAKLEEDFIITHHPHYYVEQQLLNQTNRQ